MLDMVVNLSLQLSSWLTIGHLQCHLLTLLGLLLRDTMEGRGNDKHMMNVEETGEQHPQSALLSLSS